MKEKKEFISPIVQGVRKGFDQLIRWGGGMLSESRRSIRFKLMVSFLVLSLIPLIIVSIIAYNRSSAALMTKASDNLESARATKSIAIKSHFEDRVTDMGVLVRTVNALRQDAYNKLTAVRQIKKNQIEGYFKDRIKDVMVLASSPFVATAIKEFQDAWTERGTSGPEWKAVEEKHTPWLSKYIEAYGYVDLFLVSLEGEVLYTYEQEADLGQNLVKGSLKGSPAAEAFNGGLTQATIQDFKAYEPSGGVPAAFVSAPIKVNGVVRGVVMLQLPIHQINNIMQERTGLGESGETYLVGKDNLFRSDSRFVEDSTILDENYKVDTVAAKGALAGNTGVKIIKDYRGIWVLSSYAPLDITGLQWIILSEIDVEEALSPKAEGEGEDYFTQYKEGYGYYDLALITRDGYLFYSVEQEPDYKTNMLTGPYKDSNLGRLVAQVVKTKQFGMADFENYAPGGDMPVAFMAEPIVHENDVEIVVAIQISLDHINAVMQESTGLGESGQSYLIGPDKLFRSDSRFVNVSTVINPAYKIDTDAVNEALEGKTGTGTSLNYQDNRVLSSWSPLSILEPSESNPEGIKWALISEINLDEIRRPVVRIAWISAAVLGIAAIVVVLVALVLAGGLTGQVRRIMDLFGKIGIGDFEARTEVTSGDELGVMAESLNAMLDNTLALVQTREERDTMESSVIKLLEEISGLADGDLTRRAEVTAEITGSIADSFNEMAEQLSRVVRDVKETSLQVSSTSQEVKTSTESLSEISEAQAVQVSDAVAAINEMATSIQQVAENASQSATVSQQATANAREGAEAVESTNKSMSAIRDNVQETAGAIKRLGESSQEIGNIVQLIDDIADRTSILALNASIQAAMAGDAGRGFAVVAEEVQRLAERSTNATKQIDTLVKNIQGEISEAGISMDESIQQVVKGSSLADDAYKKLQEIESVSTQLAELIQSISMAADQQARASENISKTMEEVGEISTQTSAASRQTAVSMENMTETSEALLTSVAAFKLPEEGGDKEELDTSLAA